ncbi:hypothetical protein QTP88_015934 [Uroleucon formosanum]
MEAEDDEFLTLAKGYAVKLKKLSQQQLIRSYVVHPSELPPTTTQSHSWYQPTPNSFSHASTINSSSDPSTSNSSFADTQTVKSVFEGFSYINEDDF